MGIKRRSLTGGETFGYLTVESYSHSSRRKNGKVGERVVNCVCRCGEVVKVRTSNLYSGNTKSCGCYHSEKAVESNIKRTQIKPAIFKIVLEQEQLALKLC